MKKILFQEEGIQINKFQNKQVQNEQYRHSNQSLSSKEQKLNPVSDEEIRIAFLGFEKFEPFQSATSSRSYFQIQENFAQLESEMIRRDPFLQYKDLYKAYIKEEILNSQQLQKDE